MSVVRRAVALVDSRGEKVPSAMASTSLLKYYLTITNRRMYVV